MATLVLSTVGTAIGGPIGTALGAAIGRQIDSTILGGGSREGPRLRELSVTTSSYGQPIARHFGRMRVPGTVIWSTDLIERSSREGGGKGRPSTKTYSYSASFAVALSSTVIERVGRIWADGNLLRGAAGDLKAEGEMRFYPGTGDHPVDPLIAADIGQLAPAFRDIAYVVFEDLQLGDFGNRIPALTFELFSCDDATVSIGQLAMQDSKTGQDILLPYARGFSDEGGPLIGSLAALESAFPLTCVSTAEGLRFGSSADIPASIPVLPERLATQQDQQAGEKQRGETQGREPLALRYYDEDRDYQPSVQRSLGIRPEGREAVLDLPAAMTATGARSIANANAHRSRWLDEKIIWRTGELDPRIGPGSVVSVPEMAGYWLVRSWEWFDQGIELALDRLPPAIEQAAVGDAGSANTPPDISTPETLLLAVETPADGSTPPSYSTLFAAASSAEPGWRGAALFVERGDNLIDIGFAPPVRAVTGELAIPLEGASSAMFLANGFVEIQLVAPDLTLASTDATGLAMGANRLLIGGEVVQFLEAASLGAGRWRLSGLLRGRAGTEDFAAQGHHEGTIIVLLDDGLTPLDPSLVPAETTTNIAALGRGDRELVVAPLANAGLSRRPPIPVAPRIFARTNGDWEITWTRRARGQWRWNEAGEVPLIEETEIYTVGFGPCESPFAAWSTNEPRLSLTQATIASLVAEFGNATLWVRQVGTYGRSAPLFITNIA